MDAAASFDQDTQVHPGRCPRRRGSSIHFVFLHYAFPQYSAFSLPGDRTACSSDAVRFGLVLAEVAPIFPRTTSSSAAPSSALLSTSTSTPSLGTAAMVASRLFLPTSACSGTGAILPPCPHYPPKAVAWRSLLRCSRMWARIWPPTYSWLPKSLRAQGWDLPPAFV